MPATLPPFPPAIMQCVDNAVAEYSVPKIIVLGIIKIESAGKVNAVGHNADGSVDIGIMQINSRWAQKFAREYGVVNAKRALLDPCYNIRVGAWILHRELSTGGAIPTMDSDRGIREYWNRVGNYHSHSTRHNREYQASLARNIRWLASNTRWW